MPKSLFFSSHIFLNISQINIAARAATEEKMKRFFKVVSFIGLMITSVIFGFVYIGLREIPDEIYLVNSQDFSPGLFYSASVPDDASSKQVFTNNASALDDSAEEKHFTVNISLLETIPVKSSYVTVSKRQYVVPGGDIFGIKLYTDGVLVVGMDDVLTASGNRNPGKEAGIETGDILKELNGVKINTVSQLTAFFEKTGDKKIRVKASRNGRPYETELTLQKSQTDLKNKAGLWVRDSAAGVGTITYYDRSTKVFGSLGHAVCDVDTGKIMPLQSGKAVGAEINGCYKSSENSAGELCGVFEESNIGELKVNCDSGLYGTLYTVPKKKEIPVATRHEVTTGDVKIISTVDSDGPKYYDARIVKVLKSTNEDEKNMVIEITDPRLIEKTGGIVQGMSGSPIIQNGMLVGAVTHVFLNNPLQGYAIFAENMLKVSQRTQEVVTDKAS